ncbi:MAG: rhodanese-like domain-containing protein [Ignavibacteriales bacterium]|nr:MAG: rhodanese-like domain-containing protein [Ignavibacteriales bacterium]
MNKKISSRTILSIVLVSSLLAFVYNFVSPEGIPLISEEKELKWADDSLLFQIEEELVLNDSNSVQQDSEIKTKKEEEVNIEPETNQPAVSNSPNEQSETKEEIKEPELTEPRAINLEQAYKLYNQNILFIDAREPFDYKEAHIKNAINIPADHFDDYKFMLDKINKDETVVTYCAGTDCDLSVVLSNIMFDMGYKKVYVFFGGWNEWTQANYPVYEGNKSD